MIIVQGEVKFGAGEIDRLAAAMKAQIEATRAEEGCEHYAYGRDVLDPDLLHVSERWRDDDAIAAHMASAHMAAFGAEVGGAQVERMSIKAYEGEFQRTLMGE
ncbi:MAG: antibiotic biosynthesis monooxygenase [Sphingomonadaceae bacterium]|nr:antibiotic biosynthesis monooxygenase [Sphingomonadaceae bacterium]